MDDFKDQEFGEDEVQIEDLGAPKKGFPVFLFSLGEKWYAAARFRHTPAALVGLVCLLLFLLLPGITLPRSVAPVSRPASQTMTCVAIAISPTAVTTWLRQVVPTSAGGVIFRECGPTQSVGRKP